MAETDGIALEVLPSNIVAGIAEKIDMRDLEQFELGSRMTAAATQKLPRYIWRASFISLQQVRYFVNHTPFSKNPRESFVEHQSILIDNAPDNVVFIAGTTFISLHIEDAFPTILKHQITTKELYFTNFRERLATYWLDGFDDDLDDTPPEEYEREVGLIKKTIKYMKPEFILMNSPWPRHFRIPELANAEKLELLDCNCWAEPYVPILPTLRNRHLTITIAHGQNLREMEIADFIQEWIDEKREIEFFETAFVFQLEPFLDFFPEATTRCDGHAYICRDKDHKECLHLTIENQKKIIVRNTKYGEVPPCPHLVSPTV